MESSVEALETRRSSSLKRISSSTTRGIFMDLPPETTLSNRFKILILGMHLGDS